MLSARCRGVPQLGAACRVGGESPPARRTRGALGQGRSRHPAAQRYPAAETQRPGRDTTGVTVIRCYQYLPAPNMWTSRREKIAWPAKPLRVGFFDQMLIGGGLVMVDT
jgi:hypothetical protein